jgi:hypothetical protein
LPKVNIPVGALIQAADGNIYVCQAPGTIPTSGSVVLPFACVVNGPIACPAGSLGVPPARIYQAIPGWDTINNSADGALGRNVETASEFELRRAQSTGWNAMGPLGSILGAIYQVPDVIDAFVTENDTNLPAVIGGVTLAPNSLYACVLGGANSAIAQAIWTRKMPGCAYNGSTSYIVTDPSPQYTQPAPSYTVRWTTPTDVGFVALVVMKNNPGIPANALAQIQSAIVSAFAGTDGGPRARIGSTVLASRYYGGVLALGSWAQVIDIQIGVQTTAGAAFFTGSIGGTTLTVTAITAGTLAPGQLLLDEPATLIAPGTLIVAQLTGSTTGGTGTYSVSISQTVASENMTSTTLVNSVTMDIDQAPVIDAPDITLLLQ